MACGNRREVKTWEKDSTKREKTTCLGSRLLGHLNDLLHHQVALLGGGRANQVGLISLHREKEEKRRRMKR